MNNQFATGASGFAELGGVKHALQQQQRGINAVAAQLQRLIQHCHTKSVNIITQRLSHETQAVAITVRLDHGKQFGAST